MRKLLFIFLFAAFILTACGGVLIGTPTTARTRPTYTPHPPRPTPNAAELEISDPAKTIEVIAGNQFTITVKTNRPPEYHWGLAEALDPNIIEYVWRNHVYDDPGNPNSTGRDVWRFLALAPGRVTVRLGYYRGMTIHVAQRQIFTVVVK